MDRRKALLFVAAFIAALGTMLVFLYVKGADARADARYDAVQVLRVTKPIAVGESVQAAQAEGKFATSTISSQDRLQGALVSLDSLEDSVALTQLYVGEQVVESKFGEMGSQTELALPAGKIAISINLDDPARVAGFLDPGDQVAIFMNGTDEDGQAWTRLLLRSVQVVGLGATSASMNAAADPNAPVVDELPKALMTLGVTQAEAERVFFASRNGDLSLALLDDESEVAKGDRVTAENLFD
jgi:pilus assembly protein CpaB